MSEGYKNQGEKLLGEFEVNAELTIIAEKKILPKKIAQRISQKLQEKNLKVTRSQLYRLVENIQGALQSSALSLMNQPKQVKTQEDEKTLNKAMYHTTDMKRLIEEVELLNQRIKVIEENQIQGVKGVTGTLVKTTDMKTFYPTGAPEETMQPLHHIPNDPESIIVMMKWLQYLVDRTGKNYLADTLGYYVDIGWISEDVRFSLINYSKGITDNQTQNEGKPPHLPAKDHLQSLLFIQKMKGVQLDDRFLSKIERDMEKMVRTLEEHQSK